MANSARERMVASAIVLLAKHGFQGASFAEVLADSGAPRGSIYHHFPEGKEQLIAAAVDVAGTRAVELLDVLEGRSPAQIVDGFMAMWRAVLERSGFAAGCSVLAVTVSADSRALLDRAGQVFRSWQARLAGLFRSAGLRDDDADGLATLLIAASEGAVVLARAQRELAPLEAVHAQLRALAASFPPRLPPRPADATHWYRRGAMPLTSCATGSSPATLSTQAARSRRSSGRCGGTKNY